MDKAGTGGQAITGESYASIPQQTDAQNKKETKQAPIKGMTQQKRVQNLDHTYMSYTESGFDSDPVETNQNFELNSNISYNMLPNHGYTSGFTDLNTQKRRVLLDEDESPRV